jgi:hypothetical protein
MEVSMPIRPEMRELYPSDWPEISRRVRFERAGGVGQGCGRPHGATVRCLPEARALCLAVEPLASRRPLVNDLINTYKICYQE